MSFNNITMFSRIVCFKNGQKLQKSNSDLKFDSSRSDLYHWLNSAQIEIYFSTFKVEKIPAIIVTYLLFKLGFGISFKSDLRPRQKKKFCNRFFELFTFRNPQKFYRRKYLKVFRAFHHIEVLSY